MAIKGGLGARFTFLLLQRVLIQRIFLHAVNFCAASAAAFQRQFCSAKAPACAASAQKHALLRFYALRQSAPTFALRRFRPFLTHASSSPTGAP